MVDLALIFHLPAHQDILVGPLGFQHLGEGHGTGASCLNTSLKTIRRIRTSLVPAQ